VGKDIELVSSQYCKLLERGISTLQLRIFQNDLLMCRRLIQDISSSSKWVHSSLDTFCKSAHHEDKNCESALTD
jgi:hypothetical protein